MEDLNKKKTADLTQKYYIGVRKARAVHAVFDHVFICRVLIESFDRKHAVTELNLATAADSVTAL